MGRQRPKGCGMSCRSDLPLVLERWRRFRRALKAGDQPAMDVVIAVLLELAREAESRAALA